jgi:hypothetical protein
VGGGDEIEALHMEGKLAGKFQSMGGKRITSVVANPAAAAKPAAAAHVKRMEVKFKA